MGVSLWADGHVIGADGSVIGADGSDIGADGCVIMGVSLGQMGVSLGHVSTIFINTPACIKAEIMSTWVLKDKRTFPFMALKPRPLRAESISLNGFKDKFIFVFILVLVYPIL